VDDKSEAKDSSGVLTNNRTSTRKWAFRIFVILVVAAAVVYGVIYLRYSLSHESTDNAYIAGVIVPIAPEVRGKVVKVFVKDNQYVQAGARLVEIFPVDYADLVKERRESVATLTAEEFELRAGLAQRKKSLAQAEANLSAVAAEESLAEKESARYARLSSQDAVSRNQYEYIESRWKVAQARRQAAASVVAEAHVAIEAAQAKLNTQQTRITQAQTGQALAQHNLQRTMILAPISGRIAKRNVDPGKYVQPGQALLAVVEENTWIVANFKETQIGKMAVDQPVEVKVDAYGGKVFKGHIDSVQPGTGSVFSLLPPENATGNFVKVVQRLPVKIVIESPFDPAYPLWPGLSVIPTVDISRKTGRPLSGR
jgi:membrane fusion protein, multidrug efflux system